MYIRIKLKWLTYTRLASAYLSLNAHVLALCFILCTYKHSQQSFEYIITFHIVYSKIFQGENFHGWNKMTVHGKKFAVAASFNNECLWLVNYSL